MTAMFETKALTRRFALVAALLVAVASATAQPAPDADKNDEQKKIPLSFNNAPMQQIAKFLTDQYDKPVIVSKDVAQLKVTLTNKTPVPLDEALYLLRTAMHEAGATIDERPRTIHIISLTAVMQGELDLIPADGDLSAVKPPNKIVRKIFDVRSYDPTKLLEIIKPIAPSYAHITADPSTGKLIMVATAEELMRIGEVIAALDRAEVVGRELRVFPLEHADVYEVVPMLEKLISGYLGVEVKAASTAGGAQPQPGGPQPGRPPGQPGQPTQAQPAGTVGILAIEADNKPVLLIPDPRRSALVVEAAPHVLAQVEKWLKQLDHPKPPTTQTEIVEVQYGDAEDLANQLTNLLNNIPDESLRSALRVFPFPASRRLMLVGSEQNRAILKEWLEDIDTADTGLRITRTFTLKYADAQQIAENVKEVFGEDQSNRRFIYYGYGRGQESDRTKVTVTANSRNNSLTVLASPERMERIAEQIKEWDRRIEGDEALPRIYDLKYADPEKAKELLESLFTKKERQNRPWWWDEDTESSPSPVGRLFGQFSFEAYPEMGKLIVVSKNEENYAVIERMIEQIDQPQLDGMPRVIELKYADAETLAEQLNALLNAPGTPASILRQGEMGTFQDLKDDGSPYSTRANQPQQPQRNDDQQAATQVMQFWWQNPPSDTKVKQPSNLVGKLRIVPNVEQNLLLVAAPDEYLAAIEEFVADLDKPGYQVLIKAVIAEVTLDDSMSLGYRFSTDPSVFTSGDTLITDNALRGLLTYNFEDTFGRQNTITLDVDVNNLISLLKRVTDIRIRSEPKILTADNVEGEFFDGQDIPFISSTLTTDVGGQNQGFDYFPVGITLRVRPHITQEANIDLMINLRVSSVLPGQTLFGGAIVDRRETTTRVVLEDSRTFMISGILREEDRVITRRVPGLGDIPLLGELFTHRETAKVNSELLIFITPYVISPLDTSRAPISEDPIKRYNKYIAPDGEHAPLTPDEEPPQQPEPKSSGAVSSMAERRATHQLRPMP
jgi:general secretion pathway protein D